MASKVKLHISMSLDGYVAGPNQGPEDPLGKGGLALHDWVGPTRTFMAMQGDEGGETGIDDDHFAAASANVGAYIMGRVAQQYIQAGLVDEMQIHVAPLLLSGERLFDDAFARDPFGLP
jgi:dihydrofolate reductase